MLKSVFPMLKSIFPMFKSVFLCLKVFSYVEKCFPMLKSIFPMFKSVSLCLKVSSCVKKCLIISRRFPADRKWSYGCRFESENSNLDVIFSQKNFLKIWLKEVRSKISILLETTGGILFSLEGFQKMPFTIKNFTQGDLHSTGGIQMSFLGVCNSTGGI